ncbi:MAG: S41 family peptidase [Flavobacteriales bacterium]|nr:S41 family peptidase [Flavobacteriales bacterium]
MMKTIKYLVILLSFMTSFSCKKIKNINNNPKFVYNQICEDFGNHYANFEERNINWDSLCVVYESNISDESTEEELILNIENLLSNLNDGHVSLITPYHAISYNSSMIIRESIDDNLFDLDLIKQNYLNSDFTLSGYGGNVHGTIDSIYYLHMAWISDNCEEWSSILEEITSQNLKGLILDFRHNSGGDFTWAYSEFGYFTSNEREIFKSKTKNGTSAENFTEWVTWSVYPDSPYFNLPIVMITDGYTMSATERTVLAFKSLPNVVHIGQKTNGSISTTIGRELSNQWAYTIPTQKVYNLDGSTYEGKGIPVDFEIVNSSVNMNFGIDETLDHAISYF